MRSLVHRLCQLHVPGWLSVTSRVLFATLHLLLSIYSLLAYLPDTYYAFIQAPYLHWLMWLIRFQPYIYAALGVLLSLVLFCERSVRRQRRYLIEFAVLLAGLTVLLLVARPIAQLGNNSISYLWSLVLLIPVLLLAVLDYTAASAFQQPKTIDQGRGYNFVSLLLLAGAVAIVYPGMGYVRNLQLGAPFRLGKLDLEAWLSAIGTHFLFCAFLASLFNLAESLPQRFPRVRFLRALLYHVLAWFVLDRIFQNALLATLPFYSLASQIYSGMIALALVMMGGSLRRRIWMGRSNIGHSPAKVHNRSLPLTLALLLLAAAYVVPAFIGVVDWNFLLEKMWVLALWTSALALVLKWGGGRISRLYPIGALLAIAVVTPLTYHFVTVQPTVQAAGPSPVQQMDDAITRHSYFDVSFQVVRDIWFSPQTKPCDDLCQFLETQTNLPPTARATLTELKLVDKLTPATGPKPHIFIFVVDSLRQDYVSAYNPEVQFTPEIAKFGADSIVFRNAFTRYAGTTLSEPAIWAAAMLLHKHYIQPFHKVNSLEKLLDTDGYQRFISVDTVLRVLLRRAPDLIGLDEHMQTWTDQDLCSTVNEAEEKISRLHDPRRPIFLYTQPQNIHGITLGRLGAKRVPHKSYPGFSPLVASELERLDGCFGNFISYLKSTGIYSNSIIVLTADHGDAFGEFGHKGHALELTPSVLRIPLIIHVPAGMRKQYFTDPEQIAFNVDVTPTLYYLLGHRPIADQPPFGRPLLTTTREEAAAYLHSHYLVASSYGPVYGLLGQNGRTLFVANAIDGTNQYFELSRDPGAVVNRLNDHRLSTDEQRVRNYVQQIADLYQFHYHPPTLRDWLMH